MELEELRAAIRSADRDMTGLFEKRMSLVKQVAAYKIQHDMPIYDAEREEKNVQELSALIADISSRPAFAVWYRQLMKLCRKAEEAVRQKDQ
ncbi:MAG TPA: chorismate mutase [Veillonellaceae bacterium]|jgi:chorismate mutase|nr:chorismate mutase [Veillonellaceae bacterium]